ncbi:hypothetical protein GDO86_003355, partial [Hymenochirus boettgeri]
VVDGSFVKESFHELCWTLTAKKNYHPSTFVLPNRDAFRLWCLFNYLSEDSYPLIMVPNEIRYLLQKLFSSARMEIGETEIYEVLSSLSSGVSVWEFLELVTSPKVLRGISTVTLSIAIQELYEEVIQDVLKQGYILKKANLRRIWTERWFVLKPTTLCYYLSEESKERKGIIFIDKDCVVEILSDRDGRRCMFCVKTNTKLHEMCASDTKQRQEWIAAILTAIRLQQCGTFSLHRELQRRRREQREQHEQCRVTREIDMQKLAELQNEKEHQKQELEQLKEAQKRAEETILHEQYKHWEQHEKIKRQLEDQLREAEEARALMQAEIQLKETETLQQRLRIQELEQFQERLEEALAQEIKARHEEKEYRLAQAKLLIQEEERLKVLLLMRDEQTQYVEQAQKEKEEVQQVMAKKSKELQEAQEQLDNTRESRERADRDVQVAQKRLEQASTNVRHWNIQMNRLMHPISPGGGFHLVASTTHSPCWLQRSTPPDPSIHCLYVQSF